MEDSGLGIIIRHSEYDGHTPASELNPVLTALDNELRENGATLHTNSALEADAFTVGIPPELPAEPLRDIIRKHGFVIVREVGDNDAWREYLAHSHVHSKSKK